MKRIKILALSLFSFFLINAGAQTTPEGFSKGSIVLADGSSHSGFIKDNMKKSASVVFMSSTEKKKSYDGSALSSIEVEGTKYICIGGDFFKVVCAGETSLVQKASDASGKLMFNGSETVAASGTTGKPGNYFTYHTNDKSLNLIESKNADSEIAKNFPDCKAATATASAAK